MNCPACNGPMQEQEAGDVVVDVCTAGCGGVWFDPHELSHFDEFHEPADESLLDIECDPDVQVDPDKKRPCPRCEGILMMRHFFSVNRQVEVDECAKCGGMWLDMGELRAIRDQGQTQEQRRQATTDLFDELFEPHLRKLEEQAQELEQRQQRRRLRNALRFAWGRW